MRPIRFAHRGRVSWSLSLVLSLGVVPPARAQVREYRLDAGHSDVEFTIGFLGSKVRGRFDGLRGVIAYDRADPAKSSITVVIDAKSINTGSRHRDDHLQSADFFDVAQYPTIVFQSTHIARQGADWLATGALSMHGVTRSVTIPFRPVHPPLADPHGSSIVDFEGSVRIARGDFHIMGGSKYNDWFDELRSATMADSADIALEVQGWDLDFARVPVPSVEAALARIATEGVAATVARARELKTKTPTAFDGQEYAVDMIGRALAQKGNAKDALAVFALNVELFPESASAHAALGAALEAMHDQPGARKEFEVAVKLDPRDPRALHHLRSLAP
jgi:polyisoprenoid-binding protein YceI